MDTKKLRQKILDLAIRGKLVPQDPNDEPASVLLERIRAEKQQLINEGKIKAPRSSKASDTSHYGNLPKGWTICTLSDLCEIKGGKRIPKGKTFSKEQTPYIYIRVTDMKNQTILLDDLKYIDFDVHEEIKNYIIRADDLYLTIAGTIGSVGCIPESLDGMHLTENAARLTNIRCSKKYLLYALLSTPSQEHFSFRFHQVAQPKLSIETASSTTIYLPPIKEQERIVSKVEKLIRIVDIIENGVQDLGVSSKTAKAKILSLAISGKLVPQDPTDEPAIDLLKRINPDFVACDNSHYENLPVGWIKCKMSDLCSITMGQSPNGETVNNTHGMEFHQGKIAFGNTYLSLSGIYTSAPTKIAEAHSVVLCVRAPVGIPNITEREICIGRGLCAISCSQTIDIKFLFYSLQTMQQYFEEKSTGSTFKAISGDIVKNAIIPVPPLQEQRRIVSAIESLMEKVNEISDVCFQ